MSYVYILESEKNHKYYIGSSKDYKRRLKQHNSGNSLFTKNNRPFKLVLYQQYENMTLAREIEYKLKKIKSRKIIDKIIKDGIIKLGQ